MQCCLLQACFGTKALRSNVAMQTGGSCNIQRDRFVQFGLLLLAYNKVLWKKGQPRAAMDST
mgnify:CR=1 FL=1